MNDSIYWDNLEVNDAPLVCSPNGGDPDYAFVCSYTLDYIACLCVLNAAWFLRSAYRKCRLTHRPPTPGASTRDLTNRQSDISHHAQFSIAIGSFALFVGLSLIVNGGGTKYPLEELRGQIGDACCK
jgi:hypothetical protein